jgi:L-amino acid N-acyltransferase YncA
MTNSQNDQPIANPNLKIILFSEKNIESLYQFYYRDLDTNTRELFCPYPLFDRACDGIEDFKTRVFDWMEERNWYIYLAYCNGHIAGLSLVKKIDTQPTTGILVSSKYRGKGFGVNLMQHLELEMKSKGIKNLYATIMPYNFQSKGLHLKLGFVKTGRTKEHRILAGDIHKIEIAEEYCKAIENANK